MGDRANIVMKQKTVSGESVDLYFYTHWSGSDLPAILQSALIRGKDRWTDEPYLTRIIFSEMIKDELMDNTGFGISVYPTDNEHPLIFVDVKAQKVSIEFESGVKEWSFSDYVALDAEEEFAEF